MNAETILDFWFKEHGHKDWWSASEEFDAKIKDRFFDLHASAERGELYEWRATPQGALAEVIILDQFSRQLYRGEARAFANDAMALVIAQHVVASGRDIELSEDERLFLYLPYQHSESLLIQKEGLKLYSFSDNEDVSRASKGHIEIVEKFGRFPKRNAALGRTSTPEELAYIEESGNRMY